MRGLLLGLLCLTNGCGMALPLWVELLETKERLFLPIAPEGEAEFRILSGVRTWERLPGGGILLRSGARMAFRLPGVTLFRAQLALRGSDGLRFRCLLRSTPQAPPHAAAPLELYGSAGELRFGAQVLGAFQPGRVHFLELVQDAQLQRAQLDCSPAQSIPIRQPATEWIVLEVLEGELRLEGLWLESLLPLERIAVEQP
jgi:hypothetical protein